MAAGSDYRPALPTGRRAAAYDGAMDKIALADKFARFDDRWSPKIVGEANGQYVKLAKVEGVFPWHAHADEDEIFLVFEGRLRIDFRDRDAVELGPGEMCIVPRGVEHRPSAEVETRLMLIEPKGTAHTGDTESELAVAVEDQAWI